MAAGSPAKSPRMGVLPRRRPEIPPLGHRGGRWCCHTAVIIGGRAAAMGPAPGVEVAMSEQDQPQQIQMMQRMVALSEKLTALSMERSEMSEVRSYHNAERTLAMWVRTALSLMIVGLAIDRFGLLLYHAPGGPHGNPLPHGLLVDDASTATCVALIGLGILMVLVTGFRFLAYAKTWGGRHRFPAYHGPYLAPFFAVMVALFGIAMLVIIGIAAS
jgi:uncharacterized membrane protein YidH (DUF202 family)